MCLFTTAPVLAQHPQVVNSVLLDVSLTGVLGFDSARNGLESSIGGASGHALRRIRPDGTVVSDSSLLLGAGQIGFDGSGNLYVLSPVCVSTCPVPTATFGTGSDGVLFGKVNALGDAFVWLDRLTDVGAAIMHVDTAGNVYLTGSADCSFSTTSGSFHPQCAPSVGASPAFAAKVDSTGANLLYATFLRGTTQNAEFVISIAVDGLGSAYVVGRGASDWPTTPGAFETGCPASVCTLQSLGYFVAKLSPGGSSLAYSTFFNDGVPSSIAVDTQGSAYVVGQTVNTTFPTTPGSAEPTFPTWTPQTGSPNPAFVVKFRPDGTGLVYSTYVSLLDQTTDNADRTGNLFGPTLLSLDSAGDAYVYGFTKRPGVQ